MRCSVDSVSSRFDVPSVTIKQFSLVPCYQCWLLGGPRLCSSLALTYSCIYLQKFLSSRSLYFSFGGMVCMQIKFHLRPIDTNQKDNHCDFCDIYCKSPRYASFLKTDQLVTFTPVSKTLRQQINEAALHVRDSNRFTVEFPRLPTRRKVEVRSNNVFMTVVSDS